MKIGTKSVLYGAHCFFIHPFFVAWAWWRIYGFRPVQYTYVDGNGFTAWGRSIYPSLWHPLLWLAFFVHDIGYLGKPNMDGPEGEEHPKVGARILRKLGGKGWCEFVLYHSRFLAKRAGQDFSPLCVADKLSVPLEPWWLYLPRVILTGEVHEYMSLSGVMNPGSKYAGEPDVGGSGAKYKEGGFPTYRAWFEHMTQYMRAWVEEHKDGRQDTWTPVTAAGKREVEDIGRQ